MAYTFQSLYTSLMSPRFGAGICAVDNKYIYIGGGSLNATVNTPSNECFIYNIEDDYIEPLKYNSTLINLPLPLGIYTINNNYQHRSNWGCPPIIKYWTNNLSAGEPGRIKCLLLLSGITSGTMGSAGNEGSTNIYNKNIYKLELLDNGLPAEDTWQLYLSGLVIGETNNQFCTSAEVMMNNFNWSIYYCTASEPNISGIVSDTNAAHTYQIILNTALSGTKNKLFSQSTNEFANIISYNISKTITLLNKLYIAVGGGFIPHNIYTNDYISSLLTLEYDIITGALYSKPILKANVYISTNDGLNRIGNTIYSNSVLYANTNSILTLNLNTNSTSFLSSYIPDGINFYDCMSCATDYEIYYIGGVYNGVVNNSGRKYSYAINSPSISLDTSGQNPIISITDNSIDETSFLIQNRAVSSQIWETLTSITATGSDIAGTGHVYTYTVTAIDIPTNNTSYYFRARAKKKIS